MAKTTLSHCKKCNKETTQEWSIERNDEKIHWYLTCISCGTMEEVG